MVDIDELLDPADIMGVEVYQRAWRKLAACSSRGGRISWECR
jgi:hypothetical protein